MVPYHYIDRFFIACTANRRKAHNTKEGAEMADDPTVPTPEPGAEPAEPAEPTDPGPAPEPTEPPGGSEPPAEPGATPTPDEPTTVPITRFKEVYGQNKQAERDLAQSRRDADYWRNEAQQQRQPDTAIQPQTQPTGEPKAEQYDDYNDFVKAQAQWIVQQDKIATQAKDDKRQAQDRNVQFNEKLNEGAVKHEDFNEVVFNDNLRISTNMVEALSDCEHAAEIAYHLGKNPQEAMRIAQLSPIGSAREIGKLEAKFSTAEPAQRSKTNSPPATSPVGGSETPTKKVEDMIFEGYGDHREAQQRGT